MSNEVAVYGASDKALTVADMRGQVNLIQEVMKEVMEEGTHWGTIPGCKLPSLYKAGAEKLIMTFRLVPEIDVEVIELPNEHREYRTKVTIFSATGNKLGTGVGSCTTMEGKYRFRTGEKTVTDKPVPKEYWSLRKTAPADAQALIGKGNSTKKVDGDWFITSGGGDKVEHDNPADYYNTCLKMSKKRGVSDAVLTVTAASDIFTQDIEDMPEVIPGAADQRAKQEVHDAQYHGESHSAPLEEAVIEAEHEDVPPKETTSQEAFGNQDKIDPPDSKGDATDKQVEAIKKLLKALHITEDHDQCQDVSNTLGFNDVIVGLSFLDKTHASIIIPALGVRLDEKKAAEKAR